MTLAVQTCLHDYRKPTFSGIFINFESFTLDIYKRGLIEALVHKSIR